MAGSKSSRRKQQSRLTFTPLPSSSPATKGYHQQVQDRAAAVGYEGSPNPSKRRKLQAPDRVSGRSLSMAQLDGVNDDLPTPAATMDRNGGAISDDDHDEDGSEDSEPIRSTQRRSGANDSRLTSRKRSRQQQLDFSNARSSDTFSSPVRLSSSARPQSSARAGIFGTQTRRKKHRQPATVNVSSDESEGSETLPSPDKSKAKKMSQRMNEKQGRATRSSQRAIVVESDEDEDTIVVSGAPQSDADEDEVEEEDMPTTAGRLSRKRRREPSIDSFISSSPPNATDSESDIEIVEKPKRRRSYRDEEEYDEDDDVSATPSRRKLKSRRLTRQEKEDLAEDLDDFGASSDVEALNATPRNTQSKQKSARQAALEKLKRKRSRQSDPVDIPDDDEDPEEVRPDFDELSDDNDDIAANPTSSRQMFQADAEDEDFIEEVEEDGVLGGLQGVPIEYTHYARKKPSELFKHAVEWMVQKKINPAFARTDEIYDLTFRKLDDEVAGLAGSKFLSAAWTPQFTMALKARPNIAVEPIDRDTGEHWLRDKCDACNRSGHPATYQIQFQGKPYHPHTLEEVGDRDEHDPDEDDEDASSSDEDGDQDDDADDKPAYDHQGRVIAAANTIYYVGKFCKANAETAHSLSHWRYHLNEWVIDWLDRNGYNSPEKIVQRDRWNTKKRRKYANKIADRMEQEGVVRELWREFRNNIDEARSSKQGRFTAGTD